MGSRPLALLGLLLAFALATPAVATPGAPGVTALTAATDKFTSEPVKRSSEPGEGSGASEAGGAGAGVVAGGPSLPRILGSLALVAGLIVGLGYAYRKLFAAQTKGGGAVTVISRQMLTPRHQVFVLRVGHRLLIVGDSGQGMQSLAEVTDPAEMSEIVGEATSVSLRADAFAATLDDVEGQYTTASEEESAPQEMSPAGLGIARTEVQSLLAKVRQLAGQQQG